MISCVLLLYNHTQGKLVYAPPPKKDTITDEGKIKEDFAKGFCKQMGYSPQECAALSEEMEENVLYVSYRARVPYSQSVEKVALSMVVPKAFIEEDR